MKALHTISFVLVVIGGLNWLLVGLFDWNVNAWLGGPESGITKIVYILIGLGAVVLVATHKKSCKDCCAPSGGASTAM